MLREGERGYGAGFPTLRAAPFMSTVQDEGGGISPIYDSGARRHLECTSAGADERREQKGDAGFE